MSTTTEPWVVVGPGALGLLVSGLALEAGLPVVLLARDEARAQALREAGLLLQPGGRRFPLDARAEPPARAVAVLLCVKVPDTEAACALAARIPDAPVVVFQNGLGRGAAVAELLGTPERVVVALTREGATRGLAPGEVLHAGRGPTVLAPLVPGSDAAARAAAALGSALQVELTGDLAQAEWEKLTVNAAINALTALARCPNGALLEVEELRALAQDAAQEAARCAEALGVPGRWDPSTTRARWEAVARATAENRSSSLQDVDAGRVTEVSAINGALVERARALGLPTPVNAVLAQLVRGLERI